MAAADELNLCMVLPDVLEHVVAAYRRYKVTEVLLELRSSRLESSADGLPSTLVNLAVLMTTLMSNVKDVFVSVLNVPPTRCKQG